MGNESARVLTPEQEQDVLAFDPWGERDATYRVLREGFSRTRRARQCAICFGRIGAGERCWFRAEVDDGKCKTFRFCPECCWCIAHRNDEHDWDAEPDGPDPWERMDNRWELGRSRAEVAQWVEGDCRGTPAVCYTHISGLGFCKKHHVEAATPLTDAPVERADPDQVK